MGTITASKVLGYNTPIERVTYGLYGLKKRKSDTKKSMLHLGSD